MELRRATCIGLLAFAPLVLAQSQEAPHDAVKLSTPTPPAARIAARAAAPVRIDRSAAAQLAAANPVASKLTQEQLEGLLGKAIDARRAKEAAGLRPVGGGGVPQALRARQPLPKLFTGSIAVPQGASGRLIIKFKDSWKVTCDPDGTLVSGAGRDLKQVIEIAGAAKLTFAPAIRKSAQVLATIEARAAANSGKSQPVLSSLVYLDGPGGVPVPVAAALNELNRGGADADPVEFLHYEENYGPAFEPQGAPTGACCAGDGTCAITTEAACAMGTWWGGVTDCSSGCGACCVEGECQIDTVPEFICEVILDGIFIGGDPVQLCTGDEETDPCLINPGACCLGEGACLQLDSAQCEGLGGEFIGPFVPCGELGCGVCCLPDPDAECFVTVADQCGASNCCKIANFGQIGCDNQSCQDLVCTIDPFCCGVEFDVICANEAGTLCFGLCEVVFIPGEDCTIDHCTPACNARITGDCLVPHFRPFCDNLCMGLGCPTPGAFQGCCEAVCAVDPFCCDVAQTWSGRGAELPPEFHPSFPPIVELAQWDEWCVDHARELCFGNPFGGAAPLPPPHNPNAQTPSFTDAQGYLDPIGYRDPNGVFPPDNIAPALKYDYSLGYPNLLDGYSGEGYDLQQLWVIGEFLAGKLGTENNTRGRTIKVGIVEFSATVPGTQGPDAPYGHEDLVGKVIVEPGQTPLIDPDDANDDQDGQHGAATLGIVGAIDHDNAGNPEPEGLSPDESRAEEVGCVGIAPEAELWFFPIVSVEQGGRLLDAMGSTLEFFGPGDVLNFSIGPAGACGTLASSGATWLMLRAAADLGITCCLSAGNFCCDLGTAPQFGNLDSGAIIVGACYPGSDNTDLPFLFPSAWATTAGFNSYCRLHFSNYCTTCAEGADRVHISAWGDAVTTLGYGNLFIGTSNNNVNRAYTNSFGGTSAAAPMIAGLAACYQGLAKTFFGIPLMPEQIRAVVGDTGWAQCGTGGGPPGDHVAQLTAILGACPDSPWSTYADWDTDETPNNIGIPAEPVVGFTDVPGSAIGLLTTGWFDGNGLLDGDIHILRGKHIYGNNLSIREVDGNFLIIESEYGQAGGGSNLDPLNPPLLATGQVTDLAVEAHVTPQAGGTLDVVAVSQLDAGGALAIIELYNWTLKRYVFAGFGFVTPGGDIYGGGGLASDQYARATDGLVMIRVWTIATGNQGGIGGAGATYRVLHDLVILGVNGDFGGVIPP